MHKMNGKHLNVSIFNSALSKFKHVCKNFRGMHRIPFYVMTETKANIDYFTLIDRIINCGEESFNIKRTPYLHYNESSLF